MARQRTKSELKKLFSSLNRKSISTGMMHELIELLWRRKDATPAYGRLTELTSRTVTVIFNNEFINQPIGRIKAYRYVAQGSEYAEQNVLFTFPDQNQPTTTGFEINIDSREELTGITVEYELKEIN